jgi:glycosyltransferase involved in cell wall biosynthesis
MKKILFTLPNCAGGGAEKVVLQLLQNLDRNKFQSVLVLLQNSGEFIDAIPPDVEIIDLKTKRARYSIFKLKKIIKRESPDIILSTLTELNIAVCILAFFTKIKAEIIIRESNIVSLLITSFIKKSAYKFFIHNADLLIAQSLDMKDDLTKNFAVSPDKIVLINNPVNVDFVQKKSEEKIDAFFDNKKLLVSAGRLSYQKGYDLLITAFSKITGYDYYLVIIGQGAEEKNLKQMAKNLNIENKVIFAGFQDNPYKYMAKADFFISSSRFEGFPNAVIESLACGIPVIANNYKGGINEIINENTGMIIDITNVNAFQYCLSGHSSYNRQSIKDYCRAKYSLDTIIQKYEIIFNN